MTSGSSRTPGTRVKCGGVRTTSPLTKRSFEPLFARARAFAQGRDLYVQDLYAGADPRYRLPVRIVTAYAWHSLFASSLFLRPTAEELENHDPQFTVINLAEFQADPAVDGTGSETFIVVNFARRLVVIGGTRYAGEIKKSIFTVMNYLLPAQNVLPMHCSANVGSDCETALFFGLSGTGKTTLSMEPTRPLIGDDEHGWSDVGIFNFEGGCYAKTIKLSAENEPEIYATTRQFGTVLENVPMDPDTRLVDLDSEEITENTRGAYPLSQLTNVVPDGLGRHPRNVVFLAADAFGVLPPISRLTHDQAMYHFLLGYTARVAGTERGVTEPEATFSACFGAPFLPRPPSVYAEMLGQKLDAHGLHRLAGQHRLDRRPGRRERPHLAALHPRHHPRRPFRSAGRRALRHRRDLRPPGAHRLPRRTRRGPQRPRPMVRPRPATTPRPQS